METGDASRNASHLYADCYADCRALAQWERVIVSRMLAGLTLGMFLALIGRALSGMPPGAPAAAYDPYIYGLLMLGMTRGTAQGGWALLYGGLTGAGIAAGHMTAHTLNSGVSLLGSNPAWDVALSVTLVVFALTGYLSHRPGTWGDLSVGLLSGLLLVRIASEIHSAVFPRGPLPPTGVWLFAPLIIMIMMLPVVLRPTPAARATTALVALTAAACAAVLALFAA